MISIICPTRARPAMFQRLLDSLEDTTDNLGGVEVITYFDQDDGATLSAGIKSACAIYAVVGPQLRTAPRMNRMARLANGPVIFTMNDDVTFNTPHWDTILHSKLPADGIHCAYPSDGYNDACSFPIVSKRWIEAVGYYHYPHLIHNFCDAWICDIGNRVGRSFQIPEIVCEHHHPLCGKRESDANDARQQGEGGSTYVRDKALYGSEKGRVHRGEVAAELIKLTYTPGGH